jgi:hypothetical protein
LGFRVKIPGPSMSPHTVSRRSRLRLETHDAGTCQRRCGTRAARPLPEAPRTALHRATPRPPRQRSRTRRSRTGELGEYEGAPDLRRQAA